MNYIDDRINNQIKYYSKKGSYFKKLYYLIRVISLISTSLIPFFTSLISLVSFFSIVVSFLSVLSVILEGVLSLYSFKDKWISYRLKAESLKRIKFLYLTKTYPYDFDDSFNKLVFDCEEVLANEKKTWYQLNVKTSRRK